MQGPTQSRRWRWKLLVAILFAVASYAGTYVALVQKVTSIIPSSGMPPAMEVRVRPFYRFGSTRIADRFLQTFFWPAHAIDRVVRPLMWPPDNRL